MHAVVWNATAATLLPKEVVARRHHLIRSTRAVAKLQRPVDARAMTACHALHQSWVVAIVSVHEGSIAVEEWLLLLEELRMIGALADPVGIQ